jgi:cell wall assembly regulator SMI1
VKNLIDRLQNMENFISLGGVSEDKISEVETDMGITFAGDYREYLKKFGIATVDDHEFTGIGKSQRLSVDKVTQKERSKNDLIPKNLYVIEELGIDGITIWQSGTGEIYQSVSGEIPYVICKSFLEYIESSNE